MLGFLQRCGVDDFTEGRREIKYAIVKRVFRCALLFCATATIPPRTGWVDKTLLA